MTHLDFLVVAALTDEARAFESYLANKHDEDTLSIGSIARLDAAGEYTVGLLDLGGMGTNNAQTVTQDTLVYYKPRGVIMIGIAAGFPDGPAKVQLGDLMVPEGIVQYELAKIRPPQPAGLLDAFLSYFGVKSQSHVEHRGIAWRVSQDLWRLAKKLSTESETTWLSRVTADRPQSRSAEPQVHAAKDSVIGCGEKVIADQHSEVRQWLLSAYPRHILGLEMESFGVLTACDSQGIAFLVAKASVDNATATKDDRWRDYACEVSASFVALLIARYQRPVASIVRDYIAGRAEVVKHIEADVPSRDFAYNVSTASSFPQLRQKAFSKHEVPIAALLPNDVNPLVALYGGGGSGKTTISKRTFLAAAGDSNPVLLDIKRYANSVEEGDAESIEVIVQRSSIPQLTATQLERLSSQVPVLLIVDGINEATKNARAYIQKYILKLRNNHQCRTLLTTRMAAMGWLPTECLHATVEKVPLDTAKQYFDEVFGEGCFFGLSNRLQSIMRRPFFLDLAMKANRPFTESRLWSSIFEEFFREHRSLSDAELDALAMSTTRATEKSGVLDKDQLRKGVSVQTLQKLTEADVHIFATSGDFEHELWRNYLHSRSLSRDESLWNEEVFDAVTSMASSSESLVLALEQIVEPAHKPKYIKAVYDWNYVASLECIALSDDSQELERQLPDALRTALIAVVAEKLFDPIPRTATRIRGVLRQYKFAEDYLKCRSREEIVKLVDNVSAGSEAWYNDWKALFRKASGSLSKPEVESISSDDSLIGWTAANLARRTAVDKSLQVRLRELYEDNLASDGTPSVRWRIVHVLGRMPLAENIDLLGRALTSDTYHWVAYGAARSLMEVAANQPDSREQVFAIIRSFVDSPESGGHARHLILEELVEASQVDEATTDWIAAASPILNEIAQSEHDELRRQRLNDRLQALA